MENMTAIRKIDHYVNDLRRRMEQFLNALPLPPDSVAALAQCRGIPGERAAGARPKSIGGIRPSPIKATTDVEVVDLNATTRGFNRVRAFLDDMQKEYYGRMEILLANMKGGLDGLSDARARFETAYSHYKQLGSDLQRAADRGAPNLPDLKAQFVAAQREAVELHTHMNEVTAQTAVKMEGTMTSYEEIEEWRSKQLKDIIDLVARSCEDFAEQLTDGSDRWAAFLERIPDERAINKLFDASDLPKPFKDDRYHIIRIDPRATQHLDASTMFVDEQKKKGVLHRVTTACRAHGDYMAAIAGEVICATKDKGDDVMAVNINGANGLLPKSALASFP
jgi:hypothetical protein